MHVRTAVLLLLLYAACRAKPELAGLAQEFRELRLVKGWFSGSERWVDAVDRWGGRKQQCMTELAQALGDGRHTTSQVEELMGSPDEEARPGSRSWLLVRPSPATEVLLVYYWRGHHDFLYFTRSSGSPLITGKGWWMAGE